MFYNKQTKHSIDRKSGDQLNSEVCMLILSKNNKLARMRVYHRFQRKSPLYLQILASCRIPIVLEQTH